MLTGYPIPSRNFLDRDMDLQSSSGISRLLAAAVINREFRDLLLSDPEKALTQGYQGEIFNLDYQEKRRVLSVRAKSLTDFALQLMSSQEEDPRGSGDWIPVRQAALVLDAE
ncbi:MAG: hypothetical protein P8Y34_06715 [Anaerolineales bacterium]